MASTLNPYLHFTDNARQALEFYRSVFGGTLRLNSFGDFGAPQSADPDLIMHGQLDTPGGFTLMASDTPPEMAGTPGTAISISLSGTDADELRGYWDKLVVGGTVSMPLSAQAWGDEFGMCTDAFGIDWMVDIGPAE